MNNQERIEKTREIFSQLITVLAWVESDPVFEKAVATVANLQADLMVDFGNLDFQDLDREQEVKFWMTTIGLLRKGVWHNRLPEVVERMQAIQEENKDAR